MVTSPVSHPYLTPFALFVGFIHACNKVVGTTGMWRWQRQEVGGEILCKYCEHMYVNAKMILLRLFQEWGEKIYSSMIYLLHCKNPCKCHNVLSPSTTIIKQELIIEFLLCAKG
jgi:hypothetical protein